VYDLLDISMRLTAVTCWAFAEQRLTPRVWDISARGLDALTTIGTSGRPSPSQSTDAPEGPTRNRIRNKISLTAEERTKNRGQFLEYPVSAILGPLFCNSRRTYAP
jgi:hypothetical protein